MHKKQAIAEMAAQKSAHLSAMMEGANWRAVARAAMARRWRRESSTSTVSSSRARCSTSCEHACAPALPNRH